MEKQVKYIDGYCIETYRIKDDLSLSMAYDLNHSGLPANGGMRLIPYASQDACEREALTLAQHMTQKHQIYDTGFSGVKLVGNGQPTAENKTALIEAAAEVLAAHDGRIYTGCDLNINNEDMDVLYAKCPYVLNGIGSQVNTSTATAYGVYGSMQAVLQMLPAGRPLSFLIHGLGKIGSVIAKELLAAGHHVYTYDVFAQAADIPGATNISDDDTWYQRKVDMLVLCSKCGVIDQNNVAQLQCRWIVSSANSPFESKAVETELKLRGIHWVPDVISNAGAVICDAIEFTHQAAYCAMDPNEVYEYVRQCKFEKTAKLLELSKQYRITPAEALEVFFSIRANRERLAS